MTTKKRLAIIVRQETSRRCIGKGCLNAFFKRIDSFDSYDDTELELVGFCDDGGDSEDPIENIQARIERFKKNRVDIVHVSTCMRAKSEKYLEILDELGKHFEVVGYTHGSRRKRRKDSEETPSDSSGSEYHLSLLRDKRTTE